MARWIKERFGDKALVVPAAILLLLIVAVDFTSHLMSMAVDGALALILAAIIWAMCD